MCENFFGDLVHSGPNYGEKGFFSKVGLSHFFYIEENVRILYMGTFLNLVLTHIYVIYSRMIYKLIKDIYYMYDYNYR